MPTSSSSTSLLLSVLLFSSTATLFVLPRQATASKSSTVSKNNDEYAIYRELGVPLPSRRIGSLNRWSWKLHGTMLPFLHLWDNHDRVPPPPDVFVNLRVLWNKALSSFHPQSPAYEGNNDDDPSNRFLTYRMLPPWSRWPLRCFWWIFPRWMHANIELRTAHLHRALDKELQRLRRENGTNIGVIVLGGGYDTRGIQLALQDRVDRVYELDLPAVVQSKRYMLERAIGTNRLSTLTENDRFLLEAVDLNHEKAFDKVLDKILADLKQRQQAWYTIVISEALFLYLDPGVPGRILKRIGQKFQNEKGGGASFLFADKLELKEVEQADSTKTSTPIATETQMKNWLLQYGWKLQELKIKQGATRHLGIAML